MSLRIQNYFLGVFIGIAVLWAAALSRAEAPTRKLNRQEDFILFQGDKVPSLLGAEVKDLHLYACAAQGFRPLPFQADKRDSEGRYVFPDEKGRDPERDGARLDANDEMVFMVKDAGDKCPEKAWPESSAKGVEIELTDPLDQGRAWVYLFERPGAEPPATRDYVHYRVENREEFVGSDQYEIGQKLGLSYYDYLRLRQPG